MKHVKLFKNNSLWLLELQDPMLGVDRDCLFGSVRLMILFLIIIIMICLDNFLQSLSKKTQNIYIYPWKIFHLDLEVKKSKDQLLYF